MKYRIFCQALAPVSAGHYCPWSGYRKAESTEAAEQKPCPQCGGPVSAIQM